jgi:8-oxo-dGTP pyrophosphatase MutT (NUDIX family)
MSDDDHGKRLTDRMTGTERDQSFADSEPRDAATIMLIDRAGPKPKVLMGRRHAGHKFMPGKFVFPGGRIEAQDCNMQAATELHSDTQAKLLERVTSPSAELARGFALAAVREMAEETGLLLGMKHADAPKAPAEDWAPFAQAKIYPDLAQMHFIARAVTPPKRPKRFDTRFFTADATLIAHTIEGVVGDATELVELVWIPIDEAKQLDIPAITGVILEELAARVAAGMAHTLPVPFYYMVDGKFQRELL